MTIAWALISVSNKSGLPDFARGLHAAGIEILSTGGSARVLQDEQIPVTEVSAHTGFPEIMNGRVKTLHPRIHGGILARRGVDEQIMAQHGIKPIDLVVVNLYPFEETIQQPGCDLDTAIENIDIGGPTMVRAAAKNHRHVAVVVDPDDYAGVLTELTANDGVLSEATRYALCVKAFQHTSEYDTAISHYLSSRQQESDFPERFTAHFRKRHDLRYGENPHQQAAFYAQANPPTGSVANAVQVQGKELSFNNIGDTDAALDCVAAFEDPACVIVKHANPCGAAIGADLTQAYDRAFRTDPTSAFGGIIAFNRTLDQTTAKAILDRQFVEVIAVPAIGAAAAKELQRKPDVRVLVVGEWAEQAPAQRHLHSVNGGLLIQDRDIPRVRVSLDELEIVAERPPSDDEIQDLFFAWRVAKCVKSNAIVYARDRATIGVGAGQMSRIYSARIAALKATDEGLEVKGAVMASDAFFPFRDGIDAAAEVGITAVIQPGGSIRDKEVIAAADEHGMAMVFTGMRHFRH